MNGLSAIRILYLLVSLLHTTSLYSQENLLFKLDFHSGFTHDQIAIALNNTNLFEVDQVSSNPSTDYAYGLTAYETHNRDSICFTDYRERICLPSKGIVGPDSCISLIISVNGFKRRKKLCLPKHTYFRVVKRWYGILTLYGRNEPYFYD